MLQIIDRSSGQVVANQVRPVLLVEPRGPWQRPLPHQDPLDRSKRLLRPAARLALVAGPREIVVGEVDAPTKKTSKAVFSEPVEVGELAGRAGASLASPPRRRTAAA